MTIKSLPLLNQVNTLDKSTRQSPPHRCFITFISGADSLWSLWTCSRSLPVFSSLWSCLWWHLSFSHSTDHELFLKGLKEIHVCSTRGCCMPCKCHQKEQTPKSDKRAKACYPHLRRNRMCVGAIAFTWRKVIHMYQVQTTKSNLKATINSVPFYHFPFLP